MDFTIRRAKRDDCAEMLELVRELATFERAPDAVTVSPEHFEESGFGDKPLWWAFVACASQQKATEAAASEAQSESSSVVIQDPVLATLIPASTLPPESASTTALQQTTDSALPVEPVIQLEEAVAPTIPEQVAEALPQMQEVKPCEKVIGFALYYIRYSTWKGQRMYLEDLIVTESWRGKGVGTALMDAIFGAAKVEKLHGISWQVLEWNEPAIKFYERYGVAFDKEWVNVAVDV